MTDTALLRDDMVTASDLVRQFGTWRERAARAPVYVLHRGRPRLVLASVAVMDALCQPLGEGAGDGQRVAALLDGAPEAIVIADRGLAIMAASRSIRARFGSAAAAGAPLTGLVAPQIGPFLAQAARRVVDSAQAETIELPFAIAPDRPVSLAIEPHPDGVAIFGRDLGDVDALRRAEDDREAIERALSSSGLAATARVNLRGYLDGQHPALAALTGIAEETLRVVRLVTLFSVQSRVALGDAIEATAADGATRAVAAQLLINRGDARDVTVAIAPRRRGAAIDGVVALVVAASPAAVEPFRHA